VADRMTDHQPEALAVGEAIKRLAEKYADEHADKRSTRWKVCHALFTAIDDLVARAAEAAEAQVEAYRVALAKVKDAGRPMANIAFNLAQRGGRIVEQHECDSMDKCRRAWDEVCRAAIDAAIASQKEGDA
jgi:hypothetical protein